MEPQNKNRIFLEKRLRVFAPTEEKTSSSNNGLLVCTMQKNIEVLGYVFSKRLFARLETCSRQTLAQFYSEIVPVLKKLRGANVVHNPMYPNFPEQVMEMEAYELYSNAALHYWSFMLKDAGIIDDTWLPGYDTIERLPLDENTKLDVIHIGSQKQFFEIFTLIAGSKTSISASDKSLLEEFVVYNASAILPYLPKEIPLKENLTLIVALLIEHTTIGDALDKYVKTATDVLRIAVGLSDGDVSLAENTKFAKFNRKTRRLLLRLLDNCGSIKEDMVRYHGQWLRLGERLHPGEYSKQFPYAFEAFKAHREGEKVETFNSVTEFMLGIKDWTLLGNHMQQRPGEFARRLDHIFRSTSIQRRTAIADKFIQVADKVSTSVLLQVYEHFKTRYLVQEFRPVFPKGSIAKMQVLSGSKELLPRQFCKTFCDRVRSVIVEKFSILEPLGKTYVDPKLVNYVVPFSQRSASKALRTLVRGSRIPIEDVGDTLRFFIHWQNNHQRVDLDLAAAVLDADFKYVTDLSYYNLKGTYGCHSGDITNAPAPRGASEFIDINLKEFLAEGHRYIAMSVYSFTGTPMVDLPVCFAGWMIRQHPGSGEIFEPQAVQNRVDLTANTTCAIPLLIDAQEREVIWMDLSMKTRPTWNCGANNKAGIAQQCKAMATLRKPNLFDLFSMHAEARGELIDTVKGADQVFSVSKGITPFDGDIIAAKYL